MTFASPDSHSIPECQRCSSGECAPSNRFVRIPDARLLTGTATPSQSARALVLALSVERGVTSQLKRSGQLASLIPGEVAVRREYGRIATFDRGELT